MVGMPNTLFLFVFGGCAIWGFVNVLWRTRQVRAPHPYAGTLYTWSEPAGSSIRDDFPTWLAINIHRGTSILLGFVALLVLIFRPAEDFALPQAPLPVSFLIGPLLVGLVALIGFFWGFMVGGPLADAMGGERHYAVSDQGVLAHGKVWPWDAATHLSVNRERGAIRVWSASLPGTIAFSFHPPADGWDSLLAVLRSHLPERDGPGQRTERYGFALRMAVLCAPFLAAALIIVYLLPAAGALMALALLMWAVLSLGSSFIMRRIYGGKSRPAAVEK